MREKAAYTLYCAPNTYALSTHALLEEIGASYDIHWVALFSDRQDAGFLAASPHGRVPAIDGPDGTLFETGAIALYLAERHADAGLAVPPGDARRGRFLQWLHYLASTLQPEVLIQYHPEFYFADAPTQARFRQASQARLAGVLDVLDQALAPGPYFCGDRITILDYLLAMQAIWPPVFAGSIDDYPNIARMTGLITARPSVKRVMIMHEETWAGAHGNRSGGMNAAS